MSTRPTRNRLARYVAIAALSVLTACDGTTGNLVTFASGGGAGGGAGSAAIAQESWQIQLTGTLDTTLDVDVYEADLFALDAAAVRAVHEPSRALHCYVSVGTAEPWRPDYDQFSESAIGKAVADYPQERWLDVRDGSVLSVIEARLTQAASTGCDGVELSNLSVHSADSGFPLTLADERGYAQALIAACHARGLSAGISASDDLVPLLAETADWGLTEECLAYDSCSAWQALTRLGKPVYMIEYGSSSDAPALCPEAASLGFSLVIKRRALDAFRVGCPAMSANP